MRFRDFSGSGGGGAGVRFAVSSDRGYGLSRACHVGYEGQRVAGHAARWWRRRGERGGLDRRIGDRVTDQGSLGILAGGGRWRRGLRGWTVSGNACGWGLVEL